jgi:hypothetical protein
VITYDDSYNRIEINEKSKIENISKELKSGTEKLRILDVTKEVIEKSLIKIKVENTKLQSQLEFKIKQHESLAVSYYLSESIQILLLLLLIILFFYLNKIK